MLFVGQLSAALVVLFGCSHESPTKNEWKINPFYARIITGTILHSTQDLVLYDDSILWELLLHGQYN